MRSSHFFKTVVVLALLSLASGVLGAVPAAAISPVDLALTKSAGGASIQSATYDPVDNNTQTLDLPITPGKYHFLPLAAK